MDESSPTARALACIEILQDHPGITADRLARRLGVSDRAARRYVAMLREAGVPVESTRGRYGGYRLGRGHRLPPLVLGPAEALALVMAVLDGHHDASDPTHPVGSALGKIMRALPESVAGQAEAIRRGTAPVPDRAAARADASMTARLVDAIERRRKVRLEYVSEAGNHWVSTVEPWAVVVRRGRWYLLCRSVDADAVRTYRVDRVQRVEVLTDTSTVPDELDAASVLEEHLGVGWEYEAELLIEAPAASVRRRVPGALGRLTQEGETHCRLTGTTSNPDWYAEQLAALPVPFRVVRGEQVRAAVHRLGTRLLAAAGDDELHRPGGRLSG